MLSHNCAVQDPDENWFIIDWLQRGINLSPKVHYFPMARTILRCQSAETLSTKTLPSGGSASAKTGVKQAAKVVGRPLKKLKQTPSVSSSQHLSQRSSQHSSQRLSQHSSRRSSRSQTPFVPIGSDNEHDDDERSDMRGNESDDREPPSRADLEKELGAYSIVSSAG
jgi:hypothetical protein